MADRPGEVSSLLVEDGCCVSHLPGCLSLDKAPELVTSDYCLAGIDKRPSPKVDDPGGEVVLWEILFRPAPRLYGSLQKLNSDGSHVERY